MEPTTPTQTPTSSPQSARSQKSWLLPLTGGLVALAVVVGSLMLWQNVTEVTGDETPAASVSITDQGFSPATIHVKKGQDVMWTNQDPTNRGLATERTDDAGPQTDENLVTGDTYSYVFDEAGEYPYRDTTNGEIKGTVVVE